MERKAAPSSSMSAACERRHDAVRILHHEEQIEHSDRAVLHEIQDRRRDTPGELVAGKTNDVDVDGADCHDLSLLGTRSSYMYHAETQTGVPRDLLP